MGIRGDQPVLVIYFLFSTLDKLHGIDLNVRPTPRAFKVDGPTLNRLDNTVVVVPQPRSRRYREPRRFPPRSIDSTTPSIVRATTTSPLSTHSSLSLFEAVQRPPINGVFTGIASVSVPSLQFADSLSSLCRHQRGIETWRAGTIGRCGTNDDQAGVPRFSTDACSWRRLLKHRDNALTGEKRRHSTA